MRTQVKLYACAALVALAVVRPSHVHTSEASYNIPIPPVIESVEQTVAESLPARPRSIDAMLSDIAAWLSTNFELPAIQDRPRVEFASPMKLASLRYRGILPDQWRDDGANGPTMQAALARDLVALYYDPTRTIFLSTGWTGAGTAELSVLVHEMVHHLQNAAGLKYECPAAREKLAYLAQEEWLQLHGSSLEKEFELDKFTIMINSACLS